MKNFIKIINIFALTIIILSGCGQTQSKKTDNDISKNSSQESTKTITDMSGRKVTIPSEIKKAYGANPMATILLYTIAPDTMIGWNDEMPNKDYLPEKYRNLPVVGNIGSNKSNSSVEEIIKYNPDVIIFSNTEMNDAAVKKADKISQQLGKPVVLVDGTLSTIEKTYELLGDVFDQKERSNELLTYYNNLLKKVSNTKNKIADSDKLNVYYSKNQNGLSTGGNESPHSELIEMVGGINAVKDVNIGSGDAAVSLEQVISWNPDIIIVSEANDNEKGLTNKIKTDASWQGIKAVKEGKVFTSPEAVFSWFDRPPSINQLIGIYWLADTLYPNYYNIDIKKELKDFYKLFYQIDLSEDDVNKILG